MTIVYDFIYLIAAMLYLPALIFKGKHRAGFLQRFGFYSKDLKQRMQNETFPVWLHAVSVGEIKAAAPLIKQLKDDYPGIKLVISTITPTGNKVAAELASRDDIVIYFPFDLSWVVNKVFSIISPKLLLILETEIWPNAIKIASKKQVKIVIANGRISDRAFPRYKRGAFILKSRIRRIDLLCMQSAVDAKRIIELGANEKRVHVIGNIKFDQLAKTEKHDLPDIGLAQSERLIVAGSTHYNEEEQIIEVFKKLKNEHKDVRLLIAPRHPHRVNEIIAILETQGMSSVLISQLGKGSIPVKQEDVFILDVMGVLTDYYDLAEIVFMGGSLIKHGGQNPIEPASCGKPIVFGPHMFNFTEVVRLFLDNNAAICVKDADELHNCLNELLTSKEKRDNLGLQAKEIVKQNKGSVQRTMELLKGII